ncbi:MAG TPA: hypothetical protein VIL46_03750, partial [Gemmataceae bacterium]
LPDGPRPAPELPFPFARGIATAPGRGALAAVLLPTALIFVRIVPDRDPEVWSLAVPRVEAAALAPDGREMALFVPGRLLFVRVPAPGGGRSGLKEHLVWDRRLPRRSGATAAFAPGGHWLAVAAGNRRVELLEARTGKGWRTLYGPAGAADVRALAFSPDGRLLAAGGTRPGGAVRLWELRSGKEVHAFAGHRGGVERLAFSPDGRLLASAGGEGTVLVWDVWFRPGDGAEPESADLGAAWETLASDDIAAAYRGMGALSAAGERAVAAIREGMKRTAAEQEQARRWVKDLDSPRFAVREAATAALMKYGSRGVPVLREALAAPSSDEALRRIEMILDRFRDKGVPTREGELLGGELRMLRAVQVLERVGGDAAKALLEEIAAGAGEAAEEARAVLRGWGR